MKYTVHETKIRRDGKVIKAVDKDTYKGISIYCARTLFGALVMTLVLKRNLRKAWKDALSIGAILRTKAGTWEATELNQLFLEKTNPYSYTTFNNRAIYKTRLQRLAVLKHKRFNSRIQSMFLFLLSTNTLLKVETPTE